MYTKEMQVGKKIKKESRNFTKETIKEIFERDDYSCVKCDSNRLEAIPHHIIFKAQGGNGEKRNGATVCMDCHRLAHTKRDIRKWFERWRDKNLDEEGDFIVG